MTFAKTALTAGLTLAVAGLVACNTTSERDYMASSSVDDDYVYIIDYEKIALIEAASRTSHSNVDTVWVNPPIKRIKRSELEEMQKKQ